jgi:hypothetical protein
VTWWTRSGDAAFAVLKRRSQQLNIKLLAVAEKLVAELPDLLKARPVMRAPIDHHLMTPHAPKATAIDRAPNH